AHRSLPRPSMCVLTVSTRRTDFLPRQCLASKVNITKMPFLDFHHEAHEAHEAHEDHEDHEGKKQTKKFFVVFVCFVVHIFFPFSPLG
ncbi:MAG: hypothetical protein PVF82_20810, partial [Gammaproteobacteria bacterium]